MALKRTIPPGNNLVHPVETYLKSLSEIHRTGGGAAEESYYAPLENLLNEIGAGLKPPVRAVSQLRNTGAGEPDFGLFTSNRFQRAKDREPLPGAISERGVIEAKPWSDDSFLTAKTQQVSKYRQRYGLVLVTNYRDFVLLGHDESGGAVRIETYRMTASESAFRELLAHPRKTAIEQGDRMVEFLDRVLRHQAVLTDPEDLAWFLASYAREARCRVDAAADLPALAGLKNGLEQALGMKFEGEKGEHFFRATLVQTLFYGVFSSWVLWAREHKGDPAARFNWHEAGWTLHVPMVKSLFDQIATRGRLKPLGVDEVLDVAGLTLNRVDRAAFFAKFEEEHAVQYFYEPFLKAYDPELRKELGVWYTPPEIVQYQVERVDRVLREELDLPDGLADPQVVVLDPCCGTGAYLVETLKRIHRTLKEKGASALTAQKLKKAAMERVFGFEILPAPFVVAHLQLGLMLRLLGAPLDHDTDQRVGVYLTNALTGWEPPAKPKDEIPGLFPELMEERDKANRVKRDAPILVILGNPPYNAYAGISPEEEGGLVEPYKERLTTPVGGGGWGIKKFNLDDLYVRFFRIAERRIAKSGKGIVSFISNFSYLGDPSFVVMRQRFIREFDKLWFDCMNGDSRETGKLTPDGKPDPSVFSTESNREGIRVGTAICVMVRKADRRKEPVVRFQHYWGVAKRHEVLASLKSRNIDRKYDKAQPSVANRYSFRPSTIGSEYLRWPRVVDLCEVAPSNGLMEKRGGALIDIDRQALEIRMRAYFDRKLDWETVRSRIGGLAQDAARYAAKKAREKVLSEEHFDATRLRRYAIRPFDFVWCYYSRVRPLWNEPRPAYFSQCWDGNGFFMTRPAGVAQPEGLPVHFASILGDNDFQRGHSYFFPIRIREGQDDGNGMNNHQPSVFEDSETYATYRANLSSVARAYLASVGVAKPDQDAETAGLVWMHALAIGHSALYLVENADGIRQDWLRIPLPASGKALLASAELGRRIAALLDVEKPAEGVSAGKLDPRLKSIGIVQRIGGGALDPDSGHLDLTVGWGHAGKSGVCMPGRGRAESRKLAPEWRKKNHWPEAFGDESLDIHLNDVAYWADIPKPVWEFTVGGYQVIKKWLSYREKAILGRGLHSEEAESITEMARRIAAIILLQTDLDANYQTVKADVWPWPAP
jgi:hypothetical protein